MGSQNHIFILSVKMHQTFFPFLQYLVIMPFVRKINKKLFFVDLGHFNNFDNRLITELFYLSEADNHSHTDKPIAMGIILGVVIPMIAIIALLTICIIRRQRKNKQPEGAIPELLKDHEADEEEEIGMNSMTIKAEMNGQIANGGRSIKK